MPQSLLISNGTLIDGAGSPPIENAAVLIADGRIAAAGPAAEVTAHPEAGAAEQLDASGCWIIPGLIDAHIHATFLGADAMPLFLAGGVTTVRDVGGQLDDLAAISEKLASGLPGPRLVFCGPLIDGDPASLPQNIMPILQSTASPAEAAALAEECLARGAGGIKVYFRLPLESMREVVRRVGGRAPVTGHLGRTLAAEAVEAGVNCLEHVIVSVHNDVVPEDRRFDATQVWLNDPGFWSGLLAGWAEADLGGPGSQRALESMRERDVTLDPTLDVMSTTLGHRHFEPADPNLRYLGRELVETWNHWRVRVPERFGEQAWADASTVERGHAKCAEFVQRYHEIGGRVTAGTDVGAVPYLVPGFCLHDEMRMLVEAGLSAAAVIKAATLDAAISAGIPDETGSIEAGKAADIVVLEADPLADIRNLSRIRHVVQNGSLIDREGLLRESSQSK